MITIPNTIGGAAWRARGDAALYFARYSISTSGRTGSRCTQSAPSATRRASTDDVVPAPINTPTCAEPDIPAAASAAITSSA